MPTSFSQGNSPSPWNETSWLTTPALDEKLNRKVDRMLNELRPALPERCLIVHRTDRISRPPRKFTVDILCMTNDGDRRSAEILPLTSGEKSDWEQACAEMAHVSASLASRWPKGARPESLVMITDGRSLWFNPGRPSGGPVDWIESHVSGDSPCAIIRTTAPGNPLSSEWFDSF